MARQLLCEYCNQFPRFEESGSTHRYCSKKCAAAKAAGVPPPRPAQSSSAQTSSILGPLAQRIFGFQPSAGTPGPSNYPLPAGIGNNTRGPRSPPLCIQCHQFPRYSENGRLLDYCSKTCREAAKATSNASPPAWGPPPSYSAQGIPVQSGTGNGDFMCPNCNEKPRFLDGNTLYAFCSKRCAKAHGKRPAQVTQPSLGFGGGPSNSARGRDAVPTFSWTNVALPPALRDPALCAYCQVKPKFYDPLTKDSMEYCGRKCATDADLDPRHIPTPNANPGSYSTADSSPAPDPAQPPNSSNATVVVVAAQQGGFNPVLIPNCKYCQRTPRRLEGNTLHNYCSQKCEDDAKKADVSRLFDPYGSTHAGEDLSSPSGPPKSTAPSSVYVTPRAPEETFVEYDNDLPDDPPSDPQYQSAAPSGPNEPAQRIPQPMTWPAPALMPGSRNPFSVPSVQVFGSSPPVETTTFGGPTASPFPAPGGTSINIGPWR